ncbi:hypothetical protein C6Q28_23585 [Burkholderia multivorans]|uniref:Uncharacterized protein n=1 Tax=Burkholderia multivorans TaxID=87883 RepID=A0A2S9MC08_9BURK|nr:hypothetical protein C6Q07_31730 [Burkholderia multivorans]PRF34648.1 hypothetical protein C6Q11_31265 [Burkholderia multivorans]PRF54859.1 hypothetical protein C6Q28_23585 [Burkholderia multivorans]PRF60721.1 hypothetical protein C6Q15_15045 [Burkholderia multivorans]PRG74864.1 hypothetical protein C6T58_26840 [Burkholderia multivorans]
MHRRSPCRCTFCSRAAAYAVGRRAGRRPNDYRRAKKDRRAPIGSAAAGSRRAGAVRGPAACVTAA